MSISANPDAPLSAAAASSPIDWKQLVEILTEGRISPLWLGIGLGAQALILGCLVVQWWITRHQRRILIPQGLVYVVIIATVLLLIYASLRHDLVFVVGQIINMVIGLRTLDLLRRLSGNGRPRTPSFPVVEPDSADAIQLPPDTGGTQ